MAKNRRLFPMIILVSGMLTVFFFICCVIETFLLAEAYNPLRVITYAALCTAVTGAVSFYFIFRRKESTLLSIFLVTVGVGAAIAARLVLFDNITYDFEGYIAHWVYLLRSNPGVSGLAQNIGDYNVPYLYLLMLPAKISSVTLYTVKMMSVYFDVLCAYYIMQIASLKLKNINAQIGVMIAALLIPTFMLNSAYWGQCDSIYSAFCAGFVYYALTKRPNLSMLFLAVAFSFKLQTIFIIPMAAVFLAAGKINWKSLIMFPLGFFLMLVPALIAGKPLGEALMIYINQTGTYNRLSLNAPSLYTLLDVEYNDILGYCGIFVTGAVVLGLTVYLCINAKKLDNKALILATFLFALVMPLMLPHMHDRYFYLAEIFAFLYVIFEGKRWIVPLAVTYASFRAYTAYLFPDMTVNFRPLAMILTVTAVLCAYDLKRLIDSKSVRHSGAERTEG